MKLAPVKQSMILNLSIQLRKIFSLTGSVLVNALKAKWA